MTDSTPMTDASLEALLKIAEFPMEGLVERRHKELCQAYEQTSQLANNFDELNKIFLESKKNTESARRNAGEAYNKLIDAQNEMSMAQEAYLKAGGDPEKLPTYLNHT